MPLALTQNEISSSGHTYADVLGVEYEYPVAYRNLVVPGTEFVYYRGHQRISGSREIPAYIGMGVIGAVRASPSAGRLICAVDQFQGFPTPVPFKSGDDYFEDLGTVPSSKAGLHFRQGVRWLSRERYERILRAALGDSVSGELAPPRTSIERWWSADASERFWLEVSDRGADVGVDLNAPLRNEQGGAFWSYDLLDDVRDADIVLHYDRTARSIEAWSKAVGRAWPDLVTWAARGTSARSRNIQPHERPGRRVSLVGPYPLSEPVTLAAIRLRQDDLADVRAGRPYFPFELGSRPTRPLQGYLFKLPRSFLELFPSLDAARLAASGMASDLAQVPAAIQRPPFVAANESLRSKAAAPWSRDPSEVDRALAAHARTERLVAEAGARFGYRIGRPAFADPQFDLLLEHETKPGLIVIEVKSITDSNEVRQLRLALGQVLHYQASLLDHDPNTRACIAAEREPQSPGWPALCARVGVDLVWPESLDTWLSSKTG